MMSCSNCKDPQEQSCTETTSSSCVSWQGSTADDLGICLNDSLTYVGNVILTKIKDLLNGKGIYLADLTISDCEYIVDLLDTDEKSLVNMLSVFKQAICEIKTTLDATKTKVDLITSTYTSTTVNVSGDFKSIIQNILDKITALNSQFTSIASTILPITEEIVGNFLVAGGVKSAGGNGIINSGVGDSAKVVIEALVPPNSPVLYTGSLAYFSTTGVGLPNTPYAGWFLCNGSNGTPNSTTLPQNAGNNLKYIIRFS